MPSVLLNCSLGVRKGIRPVKKFERQRAGVVICLERGANDLHYDPAYATATRIAMVWATQGVAENRPLNECFLRRL